MAKINLNDDKANVVLSLLPSASIEVAYAIADRMRQVEVEQAVRKQAMMAAAILCDEIRTLPPEAAASVLATLNERRLR